MVIRLINGPNRRWLGTQWWQRDLVALPTPESRNRMVKQLIIGQDRERFGKAFSATATATRNCMARCSELNCVLVSERSGVSAS